MWNIFDQYELRARLSPAILALVSAVALLACAVPLDKVTVGPGIASGVVGLAVLYVAAQTAAYLGRRLQARLFEKWDGAPSTRFLRWRDNHFSSQQKQAIADAVRGQLGRTLPTEEEEAGNAVAADKRISEVFASVRNYLYISKVEGPWRSHLAEYGLARNLTGVAWAAAVLSTGVGVISFVLAWFLSDKSLVWTGVFCLIWGGLFILGRYTFLVSLAKHLGERYADAAWLAFLQSAKRGGDP